MTILKTSQAKPRFRKMNNSTEKHLKYLLATLNLLKKQVLEAKKDNSTDYSEGLLMGYYPIIRLFKHQAFALCIDQREINLAEFKPDADLLGIHWNAELGVEEDNWAIDVIDEEKIKGYLAYTIDLLKEQAIKAKQEKDSMSGISEDYSKGELNAYFSVFSLMKKQARAFDINQEDISLADTEPERDLV